MNLCFSILCFLYFCNVYSQTTDTSNIALKENFPATAKKPVIALVETAGFNIGIWAFNRYATNAKHAYINHETMLQNFRSGFVWDNDNFATNYFLHPYQGGFYFNTARSNGVNFGLSALYSLGGSLMWEYFMENEPPSPNDIISTPLSGILIGEVLFRISNLIIDNRTVGMERFGREALAFIINPIHGFNRIISGKAWKISRYNGKIIENMPADVSIVSAYRGVLKSGNGVIDNIACVDFKMLYGDMFSDETEKAYEVFSLKTTINIFGKQPIISNINLAGEIWGRNIRLKNSKQNLHFGIFQHFIYYDLENPNKTANFSACRFTEAATFGVGSRFKVEMTDKSDFTTAFYLNATILGSSTTDHYRLYHRDYNYGSGFSLKWNNTLTINRKLLFEANFANHVLYSWKGYSPNIDLTTLTDKEQIYFNVQGDEGCTNFTIAELSLNYRFNKHFFISAYISDYVRHSSYRFFESIKSSVIDYRIGIGYMF